MNETKCSLKPIAWIVAIILALFAMSVVSNAAGEYFSRFNQWVNVQLLGLIVFAIALIQLIVEAFRSGSLSRLLPWIVVLFSGAMLMLPGWPIPVCLSAIIITWILMAHLGRQNPNA